MQSGFKTLPINEDFKPLSPEWINGTVFSYFSNIASKYPNKVAIQNNEQQFTYAQALKIVSSIAQSISRYSEIDSPVIIYLENDPYFVFSMIGTLATGKGYLPLDPSFPKTRNKDIIKHSEAKIIISTPTLLESLSFDEPLLFIDIHEAIKNETPYTDVLKSTSEQLAYIIYTSGSTGQPKGVFQNQKNLLHDVKQYINAIQLDPKDKHSLLYSPSVNGAIRDIFGSLLTGATLYQNNLRKHGLLSLPDFVSKNQITIVHTMPPIFRAGISNGVADQFSTVRLIYLAGDKIFEGDIELYKQLFPANCWVYIGIGSTENATIYRQWFLNKLTKIGRGIVPVGFEVEERPMHLAIEENTPIGTGEVGQIFVTSKYCALGYWKDQELSKQFFDQQLDGSRTVKTGDWGLINGDGLLEFKGRRDGQVKINGYRIEIAEVEAIISGSPGVENVSVLIRNQNESNAAIVAYIKLQRSIPLDDLKLVLSSKLSGSMFPPKIYVLDEIPSLGNFKTDLRALKLIDEQNATLETTPPKGVESEVDDDARFVKARLLNIWCSFASFESFQKNQTWKIGGGNSLEAVHFQVALEQEFRIEIPQNWISSEMLPQALISKISKRLPVESRQDAQLSRDTKFHLYFFGPYYGTNETTTHYIKELAKRLPLTIVRYPDFEAWELENISFDSISDAIDLNQFSNGEVKIFIGLCMGSVAAFRTLNRLKQQNLAANLELLVLDYPVQSQSTLSRRLINLPWKIQHLPFKTLSELVFSKIQNLIKTVPKNSISKGPDSEKTEKQKKLDQIIAKIMSQQREFVFEEMTIYLFKSNTRWTQNMDYGWGKYAREIHRIDLNFNHGDIFAAPENRQKLLNNTLAIIELIKQNHHSVTENNNAEVIVS